MRASRISALMLLVAAAACTESTALPKPASIEAATLTEQRSFAGLYAATTPVVIVRDAAGSPVPGVQVTFAVTAGGGTVLNKTFVSGPQGRATAGGWVLGESLGGNTLVASVQGIESIEFKAEGIAVPTGTFELKSVDGKPLPFINTQSFPAVETSGGAFVLSSTGTYSTFFDLRDGTDDVWRSESSGEFYPRGPSELVFYIKDVAWATGRIDGDTLTIEAGDEFDGFDIFTFVKTSS